MMHDKYTQFKWLDNIKSSIDSLVVAGGIEEYYETLDRCFFGHDEIRKKSEFYKFSSKKLSKV